jgi:WD40 repeat protein/serine/threonine protein kinase
VSLAATRDPLIGRTLGDFVVREKIGEGGFGAVYRSEQPLLEREAVIKVLHRQQLESEASVKRFLLEARVASRLDHPYAAHIYAFGVERDGLLWIAMELVRGTPLSHLLESGGPLSLERFVPLLERICEVVHSAHEKGIVHRDIKPGNVMVLTRSGRFLPKLLDFGIAKLLAHPAAAGAARTTGRELPVVSEVEPTAATIQAADPEVVDADTVVGRTPSSGGSRPTPTGPLTEEGAVLGSPHYMAPEQWRDLASADARTDIYALGVLTFEALTGLPPFRGRTRLELARAHAYEPVPRLAEGLPPALDAVLARAMAKQPDERFASALEMAAAFRLASGVVEVVAPLPALDDEVRESALSGAPQPIAEAVAALAAARTPHEAQGAVRDCQHVVARMLGLVALACRSRVGAGGGATGGRDAPEVLEALRALRRRDLDDEEWRDLARDLCRPFAAAPDAHPMPEMVRLFAGPADGFALPLPAAAPRAMTSEQAHAELTRALPRLAQLLRAVAFLAGYPLVVWRDGRAESWMGIRRPRRAAVSAAGEPLPPDRPALLEHGGWRPVVLLWPLFQVARPAPGAGEELFLFVGKDRRGARFVALPGDLERHDDSLWEWFGLHLIDSIEETTGGAAPEASPYRGLSPFTAEHAADYVGREGEVDSFLNRLRVQPLLAVVAPSGVGKSSFVQAGVVPALCEGWQPLIMRPGPAPRAALAALLEKSGIAVAPGDEAHRVTPRDPVSGSGGDRSGGELGAAVRAHAARTGRVLVLIVDQFEELFTLCLDPAERIAFAEEIASLARAPDDPVRVILTLRDDFLIRADELPALRERLAVGIQLLAMPARDDLIRILAEPARRHGYDFEDADLPGDMVDAVAGRPGALALLSFTAARLWELRDRHFKQLGRKAYQALGGVAGALAQHAEATLAEMASDEQRLVREAFRHLVTAEGTRAVLTRPELGELLGGGARAERVIERLIGSRLLVASESGPAGEQSIEVVHEALLGGWPRLVEWRREDAEGARMRDQLRAAARQWEERGRPRGLLWRDEAWAEYEIWRTRFAGGRTAAEEAFAAASAAEAARGRRIRRALVLAAFAALAAFALFFAYANRETGRARELAEDKAREVRGLLIDSYVEQGRAALLGGEHARALAWLVEARRMGADSPPLAFLIRRALRPLEPRLFTLAGHRGKVLYAGFSPDGRTIATSDDRDVHLWDPATGRELVRMSGHTDSVFAVRFSPDGGLLATGGSDSTIRLWDARTGRSLATLRGHRGRIDVLAWAPDGKLLLSAGEDGARLWDAAAGRELDALGGDAAGVRVATIDPTGRYAALGGVGGRVDIIELDRRRSISTLQLSDSATALAFDGSGHLLTASWNGLGQVWRVPGGQLVFSLVGHGEKIDYAEYSPDRRWIVTAGRDGTARVWNARTGEMAAVLRGHRGPVFRARFDPSSQRIVTAGADAAAVWERASGRRTALYEGHAAVVSDARFSPDGALVATHSWDGTAMIWSVADVYLKEREPGPGGACVFPSGSPRVSRYLVAPCAGGTAVRDAASGALVGALPGADLAEVSGDGRRAITASGTTATLWDLPAGRELGRIAHRGPVAAVDWSPTAGAALSGSEDGVVRLWREGSAAVELDLPDRRPIRAAAFTPDGGRVVVGDSAGALRLFDASTGALLATLPAGGDIQGLRFSSDGRLLVVMPPLGGVQPSLWDLSRRERIGELRGHAGSLLDVRFDPTGERLVTASGDGVVRLYDARRAAALGELIGGAQFVATAAFDSSGQLVATSGGDGAIRFWDAGSQDLLWVLDAHASAGVELRFVGDDEVVTRDWDGAVHRWRIDRRAIGVEALDQLLHCRSPVRFDGERRTLVAAVRPSSCR